MPLSDISYITRTYIELIRRGFVNSPAWTGPLPDILPVTPVNLTGEGIGFYLYHVLQKKEYDSFAIPTSEPEARFLPIALYLYYQLTANSILDDENGPYNEQLMMSIAMKAIHDCPFIDDTTLTPNNINPILDLNIRGRDNRFHISQQPIAYTDAVHNWTAGQAPMKLSAYYEISTIFLEPDDITSYSGRVLTYGNYVFLKGAPRITSSQNTIAFKLPAEIIPREIKVQPAQAPPAKDPPAAVTQASIINFYGTGFEGGDVTLRLFNPRFKELVIASPDWDIAVFGSNSINVTVREKAFLEKDNTSVYILPGMYSAQAVVTKQLTLPNGLSKEFKNSSNQSPFTIAPRVDSVLPLTGPVVTVTGYIFQYFEALNDILKDSVEVYAGERKLVRKSIVPGPVEFFVTSPSTLDINLTGMFSTGVQIPLRILIEGAESLPLWITV